MKRSWAWISVLALLLSGISVGALAMHLYHYRQVGGFDPESPWAGAPHGSGLVPRLESQLQLSAEQSRRIVEILEESRRESEAIRRELRPRLEMRIERTREQIEAILTPDQRAKFEELRREHHRHLDRALLGERGFRRPGPGRRPKRGPRP